MIYENSSCSPCPEQDLAGPTVLTQSPYGRANSHSLNYHSYHNISMSFCSQFLMRCCQAVSHQETARFSAGNKMFQHTCKKVLRLQVSGWRYTSGENEQVSGDGRTRLSRMRLPDGKETGMFMYKTHMHVNTPPFSLLLPFSYIQPIHLLLPTPSDQPSPAARGYQSPSCVGPVKWKMAAAERAHFREPSSFEGAWWPLTGAVLTWSPHEHGTAIIVFTKARGEERGSRGDPVGWCLSPGVAGCSSEPRHSATVGKHDMRSLTARWRLYFNMSVELSVNRASAVGFRGDVLSLGTVGTGIHLFQSDTMHKAPNTVTAVQLVRTDV